MRLRISIDYGLPEYDEVKQNPDKVFAFLCYRGVYYAKWCNLNLSFNQRSTWIK